MKSVTPQMAAHLKQDVTTLTTCWLITRLDGKTFGFTELDQDITYNDQLYKSNGGFNKSALKSTATFSVDNLEVNGFLTDDTIDDTELRNGAFDYAQVEIFLINYLDHNMGTIKLRFGYFGEVKTSPSGAFMIELRGLVQLLAQKIGEVYTPECRADLGDNRCKVKLIRDERTSNKRYKVGDRVTAVVEGQSNAPVSLPLKNLGFDYSINDPNREWDKGAFDTISEATLTTQPHSGNYFGHIVAYLGNGGTVVTGPITEALVDSGELKFHVSGWFNSISAGQVPEFQVNFYHSYTTYANIPFKTESYILDTVSPPQSWVFRELTVNIPAGTRSVGTTFFVASFPALSSVDMGIDDVTMEIIRPGQPTDFRQFGGVEWVAQTAGYSSSAEPTFTAEIGSTVVDGDVTWLAVKPLHAFLDTVAVDATDSSVLYLSSLDMPDDWFNWGVLKILTGANAGVAVEPMDWDHATKKLTLALPLPHKTLAGAYVQLTTGCDKNRPVCLSKFNNLLNFRGEPDVPGINRYFKVAGMA